MVGARPRRRIGRNDRAEQRRAPLLAVADDVSLFAETAAYEVTRHRHPVWKVVLPERGGVRVDGVVGAGVLVPPQYAHTCATSAGFVAVFLAPWCVRADPDRPTWLDGGSVRRLVAASGADLDADALRRELAALTEAPAPVDPRVLHAARSSTGAARLDAVAAEVGLSGPRLRALVRAEVGVPLGAMRRWGRLRAAVGALVDGGTGPAEAAAAAGFCDQAHLTRTARDFLGRTPGSLPPR